MAFINVEFYSDCLKRCVSFKVIMPNDCGNYQVEQGKLKTLYLLHGYSNMSYEWVWNSNIYSIADKYQLCVVLPSGENSFYLDGNATGRKYASFIGEELPSYVERTFGVSKNREDHFLGGLSMGGFGAIHTALQFPEKFGKFFAFSSAMLVYEMKKMQPGFDNGMANYEYYTLMFGEPAELESGVNNPEELVRRIKAEGRPMPKMYLACGTEDFLLQANRKFDAFLKEQEVEHIYMESKGGHDFVFWNEYLEPAVKWLLEIGC